MECLPMLVERPVRHEAGMMHLAVPGRPPVPLVNGTTPVTAFNEGWHAESLFTLFDPLWILVLRHDNGDDACWYIDNNGVMTVAPAHRGPAERRRTGDRLQEVAAWLRAVPGACIQLPVPAAVLAYVQLPLAVRRELDTLLDAPLASAPPEDEVWSALSATAPPLVFETVGDRTLIGNPGRLVPLGTGALQPGWRVAAIETLFAPLLSVVLHHVDGGHAVWFVDLNGQLVANDPGLLPPVLADQVVRTVSALFDTAWRGTGLGEAVVAVQAADLIGSLPPASLSGLVPTYLKQLGQDFPTRIWALDEPLPPGMGYAVPTGNGLCVFDLPRITQSLTYGLHAAMDRLLQSGRMGWPSPLDGTMVESDGFALLIDRNCFAYRFRQEEAGLVFFVICSGGYFRNYGIYFPTADLMVLQTRVPGSDFVMLDQVRDAILRHLMHFAGALADGSRRPVDPTIQLVYGAGSVHIGHHVWQDLAGLAFMLGNLRTASPPQLQVFEAERLTQFFGPEEELYPVLDRRIARHAEPFASHVDTFYRQNQRVITYTAISVPARLGVAVRDVAERRPELQADRRRADALAERAPVILIGIRVGSRTMPDQDDVLDALVRHLGRDFPGCTVVLDGLNDSLDRGDAVLPTVAAGSDLAQEFAIGRRLAQTAAESGVQFVDLVNRSALCSVLWCSRADAFVAPLGAALAKYRWICNTPGLVLSSRWNLEYRGDLHIYDAPAALEGSSEMQFISLDHVRDDHPSPDARTGFFIVREPVFAQLSDIVRRYSTARLAAHADAAD